MTLLEKFKALKTWQKAAIIIIALAIFGQIVGKEKHTSAPEDVLTQSQKDSITLAKRVQKGCFEAEVNLRGRIQNTLNDPKSFDVISQKSYKAGDSVIVVIIDYTAKNGFGGTVRSAAQAEADLDGNITKLFGLQ